MWGASKGKDMGDKGKGKSKGAEGGKGHKLPRTRVSAEKFVGTVSVWKGKYGFIQPAEEIAHEKASLHNGALYVSMDDVQAPLEAGAPVEFHIFEDESGLGAEEVIQTGPGTGKGPSKGGAQGAAKGCKGGGGAWSGAGGGWDAGKAGAVGWQVSAKGHGGKGAGYGGIDLSYGGKAAGYGGKGAGYGGADLGYGGKAAGYGGKGVTKGWGPSPVKGAWADSYGKGAGGWVGGMDKGMDKGKGKGKGRSKEGGKGHLLPRTRITAEKFLGTVASWKGNYGWITPVEEVQHEKAKLHNGGLFCSMDDLLGRGELTQGATVQFHIAEDSSGLRAEEVVQT